MPGQATTGMLAQRTTVFALPRTRTAAGVRYLRPGRKPPGGGPGQRSYVGGLPALGPESGHDAQDRDPTPHAGLV
jgi:hypothetical protein